MREKTAGVLVATAGVVIGVISLLADAAGPRPSWRLMQLAGLLIGLGTITGGIWLWMRGSSREHSLGRRFPPSR